MSSGSQGPPAGFFASFVEACSDPVVSVDRRGTVVYANPATEAVLGYDPAALRGRDLASLVASEAADGRARSVRERFTRVEGLDGRGSFSAPIRHADGHTVTCLLYTSLMALRDVYKRQHRRRVYRCLSRRGRGSRRRDVGDVPQPRRTRRPRDIRHRRRRDDRVRQPGVHRPHRLRAGGGPRRDPGDAQLRRDAGRVLRLAVVDPAGRRGVGGGDNRPAARRRAVPRPSDDRTSDRRRRRGDSVRRDPDGRDGTEGGDKPAETVPGHRRAARRPRPPPEPRRGVRAVERGRKRVRRRRPGGAVRHRRVRVHGRGDGDRGRRAPARRARRRGDGRVRGLTDVSGGRSGGDVQHAAVPLLRRRRRPGRHLRHLSERLRPEGARTGVGAVRARDQRGDGPHRRGRPRRAAPVREPAVPRVPRARRPRRDGPDARRRRPGGRLRGRRATGGARAPREAGGVPDDADAPDPGQADVRRPVLPAR
ncbi:PAS/PAC sensor signal transduction histidine kinase [Halorubrum distributum JCM 10118]|uniref:PAS/PAC sensor signal transduction histidine kinase n=1 Tax=Halorubrum distributum JCM 10118 TaxID=1227468 RepID=M0F0X1_9EURY|nr:PAS/PAC sensor signal transduction histidine kinase [Halorubrum distributum JCM 10118]